MAAAKRLCEEPECSICVDVFKNPKSLPCLHTFCLNCIKKYGEGKRVGDSIACPLCREKFTVPGGGLDKLPHNFWIEELEKQCAASISSEELVSSVLYPRLNDCNELSQIVNQSQSKYIPKLQSFITDTQSELTQLEKDKERLLTQVSESEEKISSKCADLKRLIDEQQKQLIEQVSVLKNKHMKSLSTRQLKLEMHLDNLKSFRNSSDVTNRKSLSSRSDCDLETRIKGLGMTQVSLNNDKQTTVDVSFVTSNPVGISKHITDLVGTLNINEVKGNVQTMKCNVPTVTIGTWGPTTSSNPTSDESRQQGSTQSSYKSISTAQADFTGRINIGAKVSGFAELRGRVYVLRHSKIIQVFDSKSHRHIKEFPINTSETWLGWIVDKVVFLGQITKCNIYDCLYISDYFGKCIWQITDEGRTVVKWLHTDGYLLDAYYKMSVTSIGHLIVTGNIPPRIDVYGSNARLIRSVPLPHDMAGTSVIETSLGNYVVGHEVSRYCRVAEVSEYTSNGQRLRSFSGLQYDGGFSQLVTPTVIAVDVDGHIIVADHKKKRVVLLDCTMTACKTLIDVNQSHPKYHALNMLSAWYETEKANLVVCSMNDQLDIYNIRKC